MMIEYRKDDPRYNYHADRKVPFSFSAKIRHHFNIHLAEYIRLGIAAAILCAPPACNKIINTGTKETIDGKVISATHQLYGHTDLYIHNDGSREMVYFPGFRLGRFESYRDIDGDGNIDIIRQNASEFRMNKLIDYFDAHKQYQDHKKTVDKANKRYHKFLEKHDIN